MPLFGWMKWPRADSEPVESEPVETAVGLQTAGGGPRHTLMRELLWHVQERERLVRSVEGQQGLANGMLGHRWPHIYPSLQSLIPPPEHQQLEHLCTQIQPVHTAAVLSRFREVLATNNVLPWELVYIFKQVLKDFLDKEEEDNNTDRVHLKPMQAWTGRHQIKQGFGEPRMLKYSDTQRDEIPTISSYVDRSMRYTRPYTLQREWDLPYYHPRPYSSSDTYSTTL